MKSHTLVLITSIITCTILAACDRVVRSSDAAQSNVCSPTFGKRCSADTTRARIDSAGAVVFVDTGDVVICGNPDSLAQAFTIRLELKRASRGMKFGMGFPFRASKGCITTGIYTDSTSW